MANVLIIAIGSTGDVHPFLGLGLGFLARGHRVSVVTNPVFQPLVERCGLRFVPTGTASEYQAAVNDPAMWNSRTSLAALWKLVGSGLRPLYETLAAEAGSDTVMVGSLWAFSARLVQEKLGIPLVTAKISPSTILSSELPAVHKGFTIPRRLPGSLRAATLWLIERGVLDRILGPQLNALRRDLGLPAVSRILGRWVHSPERVLALFPDWFAPRQTDWPAQLAFTGFPLFDDAGFHPDDPPLHEFMAAGSAPVVFTASSTRLEGHEFFRSALDALRALGRRGIFLAKDAANVPPLPPEVIARPYVPLSLVLPDAAALVHHGGIGTTARALAAGVPQLVTPFAHDQFDNATRVERLGCGVRLDAPVPARALGAALGHLLEGSTVRTKCQDLQARLPSGKEASDRAVKLVEAVARRP